MIAYSYGIRLEAEFDINDSHSKKTGLELSYTYYCELCKKYRNRILTDDEYYDWEILMKKYDLNRKHF